MNYLVNYVSYAFNYLISPRPLLMVAGAPSFTARAILAARDPRELFIVPGKTHIDLYDDLSKSGPKLLDFFGTHLKVPHVTLHLAVS